MRGLRRSRSATACRATAESRSSPTIRPGRCDSSSAPKAIRDVFAEAVLLLEHVGSTAVPGLTAQPIIDMLLAVPESADEGAYVPAPESLGHVLRSTDCSRRWVSTAISTSSPRGAARSVGCSRFATDCARTRTTGGSTKTPENDRVALAPHAAGRRADADPAALESWSTRWVEDHERPWAKPRSMPPRRMRASITRSR